MALIPTDLLSPKAFMFWAFNLCNKSDVILPITCCILYICSYNFLTLLLDQFNVLYYSGIQNILPCGWIELMTSNSQKHRSRILFLSLVDLRCLFYIFIPNMQSIPVEKSRTLILHIRFRTRFLDFYILLNVMELVFKCSCIYNTQNFSS